MSFEFPLCRAPDGIGAVNPWRGMQAAARWSMSVGGSMSSSQE